MISPFVSVLIFVSLVLVHILFHRILVRWGIVTVKTIAIYAFGFFFPLSLPGMVLYGLLVAGYLLFFLSFYSEGQSPSARLLSILKKHGPLSYRQILSFFTNKELFGRRLNLLIESGQIVERDGRYRVLGKGRTIAAFFSVYRRLLRWDLGGL